MSRWNEIEHEAPDLTKRVWLAMDAHKHKVMATIRADGSPRVSGTEVDQAGGDLWIGSMPGAMKARDLARDPRFAIHSAPLDVSMQVPDVKIAGRVIEVTDDDEKATWAADRPDGVPPGPFHLFRLDITEVVATTVEGPELVVESWHPGRGHRRTSR